MTNLNQHEEWLFKIVAGTLPEREAGEAHLKHSRWVQVTKGRHTPPLIREAAVRHWDYTIILPRSKHYRFPTEA